MLSIGAIAAKVFGTSNDRRLKSYRPTVEAINLLLSQIRSSNTVQGLLHRQPGIG